MPVYVQRHRGTNRPGASDNTGRMQSDERVKIGKGRPRTSQESLDEACCVVAKYLRLNRGKTVAEIVTATGLSRWMVTAALKCGDFLSSKQRGTSAMAWDWGLTWR